MGIGGTPEGVISAAAIKCLGGAMQGKLWPRNDDERQRLLDAGFDIGRVLTADDLVQGEDVFVAATGVTSGALLRGVRVVGDRVETESIVMRSRSGTVPPHRRLASTDEDPEPDERSALTGSARAARHRAGDRRRPPGHPRRRRVHGHDQEALRRDRHRVDRGEPAPLPPAPLHRLRAWRTRSAA